MCLVGYPHVILANLLASRLKKLIGSLVSIEKSTFIAGRNIFDGVLRVNEIIDLAKRENLSILALKVEFEKAFDCVSWNYLRFVMRKTRFGDGWLKWMKACVFTSSMSVLVNGGVTTDFLMENGLRQGDLLSPFFCHGGLN